MKLKNLLDVVKEYNRYEVKDTSSPVTLDDLEKILQMAFNEEEYERKRAEEEEEYRLRKLGFVRERQKHER